MKAVEMPGKGHSPEQVLRKLRELDRRRWVNWPLSPTSRTGHLQPTAILRRKQSLNMNWGCIHRVWLGTNFPEFSWRKYL